VIIPENGISVNQEVMPLIRLNCDTSHLSDIVPGDIFIGGDFSPEKRVFISNPMDNEVARREHAKERVGFHR
jgi:hypothetical protein